MRRSFLIIFAIIIAASVSAQTPEAIREIIRKNPNFAKPTVTTYQNIKIGKIAPAPKGYKPFYYTLASRHGSRYELHDTTFMYPTAVYNRAAELGILTPLGEEVRQILNRATEVQMGKNGELAPLGRRQLHDIGLRAYENFKEIFDKGSIEGKSSAKMRCVISMVSFVDGLKTKNGAIPIELEARESYLKMLRPLDRNVLPSNIYDRFKTLQHDGPWSEQRKAWIAKQDFSSMLSKITTKPELLVEKCGAHSLFEFCYNAHHLLSFAINFEMCDEEIIPRIFTVDELYTLCVYQTMRWIHLTAGMGDPTVDARLAYLRPLVEDLLGKAQDAIDGKNPHVANLRFTHDSYMVPLLEILGYKDCSIKYTNNLEMDAVSIPFSTIVPMAANLQIVLYRNKKGEVLVRSLLNEKDIYMPIECETAPFYPWKEFCAIAHKHMAENDIALEKFLTENNLK